MELNYYFYPFFWEQFRNIKFEESFFPPSVFTFVWGKWLSLSFNVQFRFVEPKAVVNVREKRGWFSWILECLQVSEELLWQLLNHFSFHFLNWDSFFSSLSIFTHNESGKKFLSLFLIISNFLSQSMTNWKLFAHHFTCKWNMPTK